MDKISNLTFKHCIAEKTESEIILVFKVNNSTENIDIKLPIATAASLLPALHQAVQVVRMANSSFHNKEQEATQLYYPQTVEVGGDLSIKEFAVSFDRGLQSEANYLLDHKQLVKLAFDASNYLSSKEPPKDKIH